MLISVPDLVAQSRFRAFAVRGSVARLSGTLPRWDEVPASQVGPFNPAIITPSYNDLGVASYMIRCSRQCSLSEWVQAMALSNLRISGTISELSRNMSLLWCGVNLISGSACVVSPLGLD